MDKHKWTIYMRHMIRPFQFSQVDSVSTSHTVAFKTRMMVTPTTLAQEVALTNLKLYAGMSK